MAHSTTGASSHTATELAQEVIRIMTRAGWTADDVLEYITHANPVSDQAFEQDQIFRHGEVRMTADDVRAEIRRILTSGGD